MKITKLITRTMCAVVLAFSLVGCDQLDDFLIDSPSDLLNKIDSIAGSKPNTGDTIYVTVNKAIIGNEDNSSAWWTAFSDYFSIPSNKLLHLELDRKSVV